jgi:hypothetical protein
VSGSAIGVWHPTYDIGCQIVAAPAHPRPMKGALCTGCPLRASWASNPAQRMAVCAMRSAATLSGTRWVMSRTALSVTRYASVRRQSRPATSAGTITFPAWWDEMNSTNFSGYPSGQSISALSASMIARVMSSSVAPTTRSQIRAPDGDQSIQATPVFSGSADRSTPTVITSPA